MKLVVVEKPSVMRDIAAVLGAAQKTADGALCGNGYIVTSARGHLVRLKQPDEYNEGYKKWSLSDLPIMPDFQFVPIENAVSVLKTLARQMNSSKIDEIIEATDAGREGECIFRYIYDYIGCTKPVRRLWISSMTEASIRAGFADLKPASEYDNLYSAGFTRSKIDWLWGINLTRLYTSYFGAKCSIGRVRTAVLNMLVQRENEISNFVKRPFYKVKLSNGAEWFDNDVDCLFERIAAERILEMCKGQPATVKSIISKSKKENRPLLFSLTSLQIAANDELGFSAARTLSVMQSLYEKKLLTYPRTDSSYLTDDMAEILPGRVEMLRAFEEKAVNVLLSNGLNIDGRIINNAKVSDHHAIIPTENIGNAVNMELTSDEKQILHLVIRRVLEALSAQYEYMDIEYVFDICGETFKLKQKKPVNLGWKALCPDDVEIPPEINCSENDTFYAEDIFVTEGETKPPKRYTESSLLKAMENIDRRIEDKELSGYVSERGLGTPATRAAIIEKILADGYAERKNKVISATEMGIKMINFVPPEIKSVEMTAAMELQLAAIENGTASADEVISSITEKIKAIIEAEKHGAHTPVAEPRTAQKNPVGKCPKCGGNVYKFVRDNTGIFYCEKAPKDCIFCVYEDDYFFTSKGKKLTESMMKNLLSQGEVKVSGFKSEKTGNTYNAVVSFADRTDKNGNAKIGFTMRFEDKKKR